MNIAPAYYWMIEKCNAPDVGYSQAYRNQQMVDGITYYDCASMIWFALAAAGFDMIRAYNETVEPYYGNAFTTWQMPPVLNYLGFTRADLYGEWLPGDILLRNNHTEMVYSAAGSGAGVTMGAHTDEVPLTEQVSINDFISGAYAWEEIWRYNSNDKPRSIIPVLMGGI